MSVLNISSEQYHQDDVGAATATLNSSILHTLITQTPAHARAAHPRLNPNYQPKTEEKFDRGVAAHSLLLQGVELAHICHYDDWRKAEAREAREQARMHGRLPLLAKQWAEVQAMLEEARAQLARTAIKPGPLTNGQPEQTLIWDDNGVLCRCRIDWLHNDHATVDDVKTSGVPLEGWVRRTMWDIGAATQAVFYARGVRAVFGVEPTFRFIHIETTSPHLVSVISLAPAALALAEEQVEWGMAKWRDCLARDEWPGHPDRVAYAEPPGWLESQWLERQELGVAA